MANDNRDGNVGIIPRMRPWLLIAVAAALACVCVRAEAYSKWYVTQELTSGFCFC